MSDLKNIQNDYLTKLNNNLSLEEINQIKDRAVWKKWSNIFSIQKHWIYTRVR